MITTMPYKGNIQSSREHKKQGSILTKKSLYNPSFSGAKDKIAGKSKDTIVKSLKDEEILKVFSQHYGSIGSRIGEKLHKLSTESEFLKKSSRFSHNKENGALSIDDKNIGRSVVENIIFPFVTLPLYGANFLLKKAQSIPALKEKATELYQKSVFRLPRKMNEMDSKTDIFKGMLEKTEKTIADIAKEKNMKPDELLHILANPEKHPEAKKIIEESNEKIKESLYKVGNKFFDKHTGNFNTAYERPLNRIITGAIPVAFLANDAYNLSVLCGDSKEISEKEADERKKQEIIRIATTAYIQLLMFGAFTRQVNTIPWFAPVMSGVTVGFSEIFSRHELGKPIFFLSKEDAVAYNEKHPNINKPNASAFAGKNSEKKTNNIKLADNSTSNIFKGFEQISFKAENKVNKEEKQEKQRALMNFGTFKKSVAILVGTFFALNFAKNSSFTKDTKLVKAITDFGKEIKKKFYNPHAYKDFSITTERFNEVMESLRNVGCEKVAEGHEFMLKNYSKTKNGIIKMYKSSLNSNQTEKVANETIEEIKKYNPAFSKKQNKTVIEAIKTAVKLSDSDISEKHFDKAAKKAMEIINNKKVELTDEQKKSLEKFIENSIKNNAKESAIQIDTKMKPFVDIVTEPFKFIFSAARLPFKLVKSGINLMVSPIEKKAQKAALGEAELKGWEQKIHGLVTEVFGEKQGKTGKISQVVFANAMEKLEKKTLPFRTAEKALNEAKKAGKGTEEIKVLEKEYETEKHKLMVYVNSAVEKSFNGVTQSSNKNTDLALMSKLASSTVTSAFLVADNYNMVMIKSNGEDKSDAKEKANERIIQRLSGLFYQAMFINWFNATFRSTYNSSLMGMATIAVPNTLTTEILTRKSIGMPVGRKTLDELNQMEAENENRKGILGKYFEFMRLLTGKKPLKDRLPKEKQVQQVSPKQGFEYKSINMQSKRNTVKINQNENSTNVLEMLSKK